MFPKQALLKTTLRSRVCKKLAIQNYRWLHVQTIQRNKYPNKNTRAIRQLNNP